MIGRQFELEFTLLFHLSSSPASPTALSITSACGRFALAASSNRLKSDARQGIYQTVGLDTIVQQNRVSANAPIAGVMENKSDAATGLLVSSITPWKPRVNLWVIAVVVAMAARAARDRRRRITADVAIEVRDDNIVDRRHRTAKQCSHPLDLSDEGLLADLKDRVESGGQLLGINADGRD